LISNSFFVKFFPFYLSLFAFLLSVLYFYCLLLCRFDFLSSFVFPLLFLSLFYPCFSAHMISSLACPNLIGTKRLSCYCCCYDMEVVWIGRTNDLSSSSSTYRKARRLQVVYHHYCSLPSPATPMDVALAIHEVVIMRYKQLARVGSVSWLLVTLLGISAK
jgi:hypothetical protein